MSPYRYVGIIRVLVGLFEMVVTPLILQHMWAKQRQSPPRAALALRMTRMSGLVVLIVGLLFLFS